MKFLRVVEKNPDFLQRTWGERQLYFKIEFSRIKIKERNREIRRMFKVIKQENEGMQYKYFVLGKLWQLSDRQIQRILETGHTVVDVLFGIVCLLLFSSWAYTHIGRLLK